MTSETKEGNKGGRPRLFSSPEALQEKADEYYSDCVDREAPLTIQGLVYFMGFDDRHALSEYEKYDGFSSTIKRIRNKIEAQKAENLISAKGNVTGLIFDLKNNHGWKDKRETEHSGGMKITAIEHTIVDP